MSSTTDRASLRDAINIVWDFPTDSASLREAIGMAHPIGMPCR